jgi:hypothetical protein
MGDLRVPRLCGVPRHRGRGRSAIIGMPSCYVGEIQVTSSEAEGMRGCFEVERRSVDKCRWCRDADAKMTIALLVANVAERGSLYGSSAWRRLERARQHRLKSLGNKQDSSRCVVCGVGDGWGDGVFNSDEKVRVRERVRKRRKRLA